jgi:hypothetical protein
MEKAMTSYIDTKPVQPYFAEFVRCKGLLVGQKWESWEYINWIGEKTRKFAHERGKSKLLHQEEFIEWLKGESE